MTRQSQDILVKVAIEQYKDVLQRAGVESPRLDSRVLLASAIGREAKELVLHSDISVTPAQAERAHAMVQRRAAGEPVSRILGRREFWSHTFELDGSTLDPRPDTETVVQAALSAASVSSSSPKTVLDLGTGTGCLLISLLKEWPHAKGVGVDIHCGAVALARNNATRLGVQGRCSFIAGHWASALNTQFDIIVSNPPYIKEADIPHLQAEVRCFDPTSALDGGADGLDAYRQIIPVSASLLSPGGGLFLEVGAGQEDAVSELLCRSGFARIQAHTDLSGQVRCLSSMADKKKVGNFKQADYDQTTNEVLNGNS